MKTIFSVWLALMAFVCAGKLEFKALLQDLHAPPEAKTVTAEFEFTNKTDKEVTVKEYKPTCSCISVMIKEGKLRYAPGESGLLRAEFDMQNFSGVVDKVIALWLDADPADKPSMSLTVRVHIPVLVELEPKTLKWELGGKGEAQTIKVSMKHDKPIRIKAVTSSSEAFKCEVKTVEDGKSYDIVVTPDDVTNAQMAVFRLETDSEIKKFQVQQAFGIVRKPSPAEIQAKP